MTRKTTGQQIRDARLAAGLGTQQMLVDEINRRRPRGSPQLRQGHISALENGYHCPTRAMLAEIARATGHFLQERLFTKL